MKKKLLCFLLVLVCAFGAFGCAANGNSDNYSASADEFVEVYCVIYKAIDSTTSIYSKISLSKNSESAIEITKPENENESIWLNSLSIGYSHILSRDKTNLDDLYSKKANGSYYLRGAVRNEVTGNYKYYSYKIDEIEIDYVSVKMIDSRTISIKNSEGQKTVSTEYYEIQYFN